MIVLSVDLVEGGCANNYVHVYGDPSDLSGKGLFGWCWKKVLNVGSAVIAPMAGCALLGPWGCAAGAAVGFGARTWQRVNRCGREAVVSAATRDDALVTAFTAGLVSGPLRAAKAGLGATGGLSRIGAGVLGRNTAAIADGAQRLARSGALSAGASGFGALPYAVSTARQYNPGC